MSRIVYKSCDKKRQAESIRDHSAVIDYHYLANTRVSKKALERFRRPAYGIPMPVRKETREVKECVEV